MKIKRLILLVIVRELNHYDLSIKQEEEKFKDEMEECEDAA